MHSFGYRVNALLTLGVTTLALMCAMASFSDNFNYPSPSADVQVMNVNWFQKQSTGNDEVSLTLKISADLQSTFTWNTQQVFSFLAAEYETPDNGLNQEGYNSYVVAGEANLDETGKHLPGRLDKCPVARECLSLKIAALLKYASRISLWDSIIPSKERAKFTIHTKNKYRLIDQGCNLRGKDFNLTLHWHVMPKTGKMFADKIVMTGYRLPEDYR